MHCRIELHPEGMWAAILDKESRCSTTTGALTVQPEQHRTAQEEFYELATQWFALRSLKLESFSQENSFSYILLGCNLKLLFIFWFFLQAKTLIFTAFCTSAGSLKAVWFVCNQLLIICSGWSSGHEGNWCIAPVFSMYVMINVHLQYCSRYSGPKR